MDTHLERICIEGLIQSDHCSFDMLFMHYYPKVKSVLTGFIKNEDEAKDMAQDIFYRLWINRAELVHVVSLKAYLFRTIRNMVYDRYKHQLVHQKYTSKQTEIRYTDTVEEEVHAKELEVIIDIAIQNMPKQRKLIYLMSRKEGLSNEKIAEKMNISKRTVENHLTQALADIRKSIHNMISILL